jgi:hypothetical protein
LIIEVSIEFDVGSQGMAKVWRVRMKIFDFHLLKMKNIRLKLKDQKIQQNQLTYSDFHDWCYYLITW